MPKSDTKDNAFVILESHMDETGLNLSQNEGFTRSLRRRIDMRVMLFPCLCYTMNFLDKVLLNYAQVMGMATAIHLTGNDYSDASASFWIANLIAGLPNIWILNRFPVARWLATACHAALSSHHGLLAVRIISGAFEAGIPPAPMLLSSQYFTRAEQAPRFAYWYSGLGFGQIIGGLVSFGFQFVSPHAALSGWRLMFLVFGLVTILLGLFVYFAVPDSPMQARFLTNEEKVALLEHVKINQTGIENQHFHPRQLVEGLADFQAWAIFLIVLLNSTGAGVVTVYSATLLKGFRYTSKQSALLNMPSGAINVITTLSYAYFVRWYGRRWLVTIFGVLMSVLGACLLAFCPTTMRGGLLAGLYLINFNPGVSLISWQWLTCNTAGHTKRTYATAGLNIAFAAANIIGPETFRAKDAPGYYPAKLVLVVFLCISLAVIVVLRLYYGVVNKAKDRNNPVADEDIEDDKAYAGLTDKENVLFRYVY